MSSTSINIRVSTELVADDMCIEEAGEYLPQQ